MTTKKVPDKNKDQAAKDPLATAQMGRSFADVITATKAGKRVTREFWNIGPGPHEDGSKPKLEIKQWLEQKQAGTAKIFVIVSEGNMNTYQVNTGDLHAEDWIIL